MFEQEFGHWIEVKDGDVRARAIFDRHYSRIHYKDGRQFNPNNPRRNLFCGPGEKMVLLTTTCDALFIWRKFESGDGQQGLNCMVFRNESPFLSSELILEAEQLAHARWPGERLYTYVKPDGIKSTNPGFCFLRANWSKCGVTKVNKLIILEKYPSQDGNH